MSTYGINWRVALNPEQTDSMFYCFGEGVTEIGTLRSNGRVFHIVANGEVRLNLPNGDVVRYTEDLLSLGVDTDDKLSKLLDRFPQVLVNNNWFEWYEEEDGIEVDPFWEVHDTVDECVATIVNLLNEEN